jgi:hypothetical protein
MFANPGQFPGREKPKAFDQLSNYGGNRPGGGSSRTLPGQTRPSAGPGQTRPSTGRVNPPRMRGPFRTGPDGRPVNSPVQSGPFNPGNPSQTRPPQGPQTRPMASLPPQVISDPVDLQGLLPAINGYTPQIADESGGPVPPMFDPVTGRPTGVQGPQQYDILGMLQGLGPGNPLGGKVRGGNPLGGKFG